MINRLSGFLLSQHGRLKGWELPLAGLLLMAGVAATISTMQSAAPQKQTKALPSTSAEPKLDPFAPRLDLETPQPQAPTVAPSPVGSPLEPPAPQSQAKAVDPSSVASTLEALPPLPQEPVITSPSVPSTSVPSTFEAPAPKLQKQAVPSTAVAPTWKEPAPKLQKQAVPSTAVAPAWKEPAPKPQKQAVNPTSVAPTWKEPAPKPQKQAVPSTALVPAWKEPAPLPQKQAVPSTAVAPAWKEPAPKPQKQAVPSTAVARQPANSVPQVQATPKATIAQPPAPNDSLADGTYLYGQSSKPQEIGKEYLVFEARQGKVVGAMYMPGSEFTCFQGSLVSKQLNLTVANAYNQTAISHTIAAQPTQLAAAGGQINLQNTYDSLSYPHTIRLEDYQPIGKVSDNDKQILNSCRNNPQASQGEVE